ncbi:hypothetical protein [Rhizobium mayense]|uniref:Uncharacterized protein n=1 Tax=Rhizobium mayense TaxID=1312184 RepID=A0ABT7JZ69_9HYPH|nr:hypothetical protein [Rhizobium mayense]MDL2401639.1 hypothetical protein [Rhizobium mayense]
MATKTEARAKMIEAGCELALFGFNGLEIGQTLPKPLSLRHRQDRR